MTETASSWMDAPTWYARIYLAGDIETAKQVCREECMREGLCVTVEPCEYIYTGGQESGYCVGLINYPRFPSLPGNITLRATMLADLLMRRTCQWSALVMTPERTELLSLKPDNAPSVGRGLETANASYNPK